VSSNNKLGSVRDLEQIYAALFALVSANQPTWMGEDGDDKTFTAYSRVPKPPGDINQGELPVLYQEELPFDIKPAVETIGGRYQYKLRVDLVVVLANNGVLQPVGSEITLPTRELNRAIVAVLEAIAPAFPGAKQTLGQLVDSVYVEGKVERIVGLPGDGMQLSVGVIPVNLLTI
jgi:hypothetical protein